MLLETGFLDFDPVQLPPTGEGPLSGRRFAVKDIYQIAGTVTGIGNPAYRASHEPATRTAPLVQALLAAGAELVGKTHTDELTYSLAGENVHYGTPPNPAVPDGVPGGSSSGSASVVAAGLVDFAMGSDTGGSVRIPASYCGIYGIRPSHGLVDDRDTAHLAVSFDTLGWFAPDAAGLRDVGTVLLPDYQGPALNTLRPIAEALELCGPALSDQLAAHTAGGFAGLTPGPALSVGSLEALFGAFRPLQAWEAWACFGRWIRSHQPAFGPGIRERFQAAAGITDAQARDARLACARYRTAIRALVADGTVLCLPTAPSAALPRNAGDALVDEVRYRTLCLTAIAGVSGLPQVTLPMLRDERGPVGLSLIGPPGSDRALLELITTWENR